MNARLLKNSMYEWSEFKFQECNKQEKLPIWKWTWILITCPLKAFFLTHVNGYKSCIQLDYSSTLKDACKCKELDFKFQTDYKCGWTQEEQMAEEKYCGHYE